MLRRCDADGLDCTLDAQVLRNGTIQRGVSTGAGTAGVLTFQASAGQGLSFLSVGGSGQASLYGALGRVPSADDNDNDNDGASMRSSTSQAVRFTAPRAGTYVLKREGAIFDGVSLLARQGVDVWHRCRARSSFPWRKRIRRC